MVHITSGVSALVCALYLGKRVGYPDEPMKPHSLVLSFIGACLLWVGWFGFNAGSALAASEPGDQRFCRDAFCCGRGGAGLDARRNGWHGKPSVLGGDLRARWPGLVAITPASGFVTPMSGAADRLAGRRRLLLHGGEGEELVWAMTIRSMRSVFTARVERWERY